MGSNIGSSELLGLNNLLTGVTEKSIKVFEMKKTIIHCSIQQTVELASAKNMNKVKVFKGNEI